MKTVIGPDTHIPGALSGKDDIEIHGVVDGSVQGDASVTIAAGARITGAVRGRDVTIAGELSSSVHASGLVRLLASARLTGDIEAPRVAIDEGAVFEGQVRMMRAHNKNVQAHNNPVAPVAVVADKAPAPPVHHEPARPAPREIPSLASPGRKPLIRKTS
jgi:cytoskeletal protein CcmA (bactofilin family)